MYVQSCSTAANGPMLAPPTAVDFSYVGGPDILFYASLVDESLNILIDYFFFLSLW